MSNPVSWLLLAHRPKRRSTASLASSQWTSARSPSRRHAKDNSGEPSCSKPRRGRSPSRATARCRSPPWRPRSGITEQGAMHYFPTKEHLLVGVLDAYDLADEEGYRQATGSAETLIGGLLAAMRHRLEHHGQTATLISVLMAESVDPTHAAHTWFVERNRKMRENVTADPHRRPRAAVSSAPTSTSRRSPSSRSRCSTGSSSRGRSTPTRSTSSTSSNGSTSPCDRKSAHQAISVSLPSAD